MSYLYIIYNTTTDVSNRTRDDYYPQDALLEHQKTTSIYNVIHPCLPEIEKDPQYHRANVKTIVNLNHINNATSCIHAQHKQDANEEEKPLLLPPKIIIVKSPKLRTLQTHHFFYFTMPSVYTTLIPFCDVSKWFNTIALIIFYTTSKNSNLVQYSNF